MGGLTSAVDWWEEWQLRVLVLTSLAIQFLLLILSFLRRYAIPRFLRSIMWLAYLAGDAVAIYALATLFNRHKVVDQHLGGGSRSTLELIWVPILLIHLGGHDSITAYNIEDNQLWTRHLLTGVSQVTVAIYVFSKSWPSSGNNWNLLYASILLFITGVYKCLLKPLVLKRASIYSLVSSTAGKQNQGEMYPLEEFVKRAKSFVDKPEAAQGVAFEDNEDQPTGNKEPGMVLPFAVLIFIIISIPLEDVWSGAWAFVRGFLKDDESESRSFCGQLRERLREAQRNYMKVKERRRNMNEPVNGDHPPSQGSSFRGRVRERLRKLHEEGKKMRKLIEGPVEFMKLFVDLSTPYRRRLTMFKYVWVLNEGKTYDSLRSGLANAFLLLYTNLKTAEHYFIILVTSSRVVLPCLSISYFHKSHREAQDDGIDVKITYAMLCCTAVLEASSSIFPRVLLSSVAVKENNSLRDAWPEMVAQYSLIGYFARSKRHRSWMWVASLFQCKDFLNQHWCMKSCFSSSRISELVLRYLKDDGWKKGIKDASSYRRFNDHSSRWVLERNHCMMRMKMPLRFDECVLLWHIATDICFFFPISFSVSEHICASAEVPTILTRIRDISNNIDQVPSSSVDQTKSQCRQISNYMVYLLFVNPEMLLPGARRNLFITAYDNLKDTIEDNKLAIAYKEIKDILKDKDKKRINVYQRVRAAMKEIKEILRDSSRNPISWSQWKPAPVKKKRIMERVVSTMRNKSKNETFENESKQDCEQESKGGPGEEYSKGGPKENFIDDAWALAQVLLDLGQELGDEKMWQVIQGVWVEMLCYSASRCRGYLHAKALGEGGEFLSYIWLLLFHMGMETFTDKLQREQEPPSCEAGNNDKAEATREVSMTSTMDRLQREYLPSQGRNQYGTASTSEICEVADDVV